MKICKAICTSIPMRMALGIFWLVTEMAQLDGSEPTADGTLEKGSWEDEFPFALVGYVSSL